MTDWALRFAILAAAVLLDRRFGEPDWLWRRVRHPVVVIGDVIGWFDRRRMFGENPVAAIAWGVVLLLVFGLAALLIGLLVGALPPIVRVAMETIIVAILLAHRSLSDHVAAVGEALDRSLDEGRVALSMIVGRDVTALDESDVRRSALESLAENASDGVVAPAFWFAVAGVPGIVFYKAVNTADSMIGHRTPRHEFVGKAAARLDDVMNWVPARLTALLIWIIVRVRAEPQAAAGVRQAVLRDARNHRSPNAGWPEAAFAAALDLRFGGPRRYGDEVVNGATLNTDGRRDVRDTDVLAGLRLFDRLGWLLLAVTGLLFVFL